MTAATDNVDRVLADLAFLVSPCNKCGWARRRCIESYGVRHLGKLNAKCSDWYPVGMEGVMLVRDERREP